MGINGFPVNFNPAQTQLFSPDTGQPTNNGLRFFLQLFGRTGSGNGLPTVASGLTAEGVDQGSAFVLDSDWNYFSTVGSGAGAVIPELQVGADIIVWNFGAHALFVYPANTSPAVHIDALGDNAPYSLAPGKMQWFRQATLTQILSMQLG